MTSNFPNQPSASKDAPQDSTDPVSGKTVAEILGEIVWLMTQDPDARDLPIREIERVIMPAILLRQFHIKYVHIKNESGLEHHVQPVAVDILNPQYTPKDDRNILVTYKIKAKNPVEITSDEKK